MSEVLEVCGLSYAYADGFRALEDISFRAYKGEKVFFHGGNGAGKTTLFQCVAGLIAVREGVIKINGTIVKKSAERMKSIGIVFQNANDQIIAGSVFDEVAFGPLNMDLPRVEVLQRAEDVMRAMNITHLRDRPPHFLSYGQKKRVAIASILSMKREILILDEPTAGMDARQTEELIDILEELAATGVTLLIATHDAEFSYRCADRVLVINNGRLLCEGSPEEVFSSDDKLREAGIKKPIVMEVYETLLANGIVDRTDNAPRTLARLKEIISAR